MTRILPVTLALAFLSTTWLISAEKPQAKAEHWTVLTRKRIADAENPQTFKSVEAKAVWNPRETAIIIVDMWNDHHCKSAAKRVVEMAPAMNKTIKQAREQGVFIIHAPSNCMDFYKDTPARQRAITAAPSKADVPFQWNYFNPKREGTLAAKYEAAGCSCDSAEPCGPDFRAWTRQIAALEIDDSDAISDNGQEVFNLLEARGIKHVIVMGVHTNRCVLGRPFGIRQMVYVGKDVVLCRDLTDSYHRDPGHHFEGLATIIAHVEKHWCPTITSTSITGEKPFQFAASQPAE